MGVEVGSRFDLKSSKIVKGPTPKIGLVGILRIGNLVEFPIVLISLVGRPLLDGFFGASSPLLISGTGEGHD